VKYEKLSSIYFDCFFTLISLFNSTSLLAANSKTTALPQILLQSPYYGTPAAIPGLIEAEDFDLGGESEAYHDSDTGNNCSAYRIVSDVDIESR